MRQKVGLCMDDLGDRRKAASVDDGCLLEPGVRGSGIVILPARAMHRETKLLAQHRLPNQRTFDRIGIRDKVFHRGSPVHNSAGENLPSGEVLPGWVAMSNVVSRGAGLAIYPLESG